MIRKIPQKDCKVQLHASLDKENGYNDGVACRCGKIIVFKNRQPYEKVIVKCPICDWEILYG